jgi:sec-independent protein translocase protein TatB
MLDIAPTELLVIAIVALVVIGPKDLPRVMRVVGKWVGRARGVARHFREGLDEIVRQSELEEMEKKWRAENERIMREHPATTVIEGDAQHQPMLPAAEPEYPPHPASAPTGERTDAAPAREPIPGEVAATPHIPHPPGTADRSTEVPPSDVAGSEPLPPPPATVRS